MSNRNYSQEELRAVLGQMGVTGVTAVARYGSGHINDTFLARTEKGNFVLQRVNGYVFPHPDEIMDNMETVIDELSQDK